MSISSRSSSVQINLKSGKNCICLCGLKLKRTEEKQCPDRLKNWELWMERRERMHDILAEKLDCEPGDLVMNSGDTYRNIREEKLILGYTKIETYFDKYRGNPDFWKLPLSLKNRVSPYESSEYFVVKSKEEKHQIPDIEYVGVPDFILDEKNVLPRTRNLKSLWSQSSYRKQVVERVHEKLLEIEPHKPDLSNLIILGSNVASQTKKPSLLVVDDPTPKRQSRASRASRASKHSSKEIKSDNLDSIALGSAITLSTPFSKISLKINHKELNEYSKFALNEYKTTIIFEYFTDAIVPSERVIVFENTGQVTLRLYWKQYKKLKIFREFTDNSNIFHPFKFFKTELLLLPGMKKKFPIWFQVDRPGNYFEYWEITSLPKIWASDLRLIIVLKGFALIRDYDHRVHQMSEKLSQRIRNTAIKDLLNDMISSGTYCAPGKTNSFNFSEKESFESVNLITNIGLQTPKYIYNPVVISELRQFYEHAKSSDDPEEWNLSIKTLIEIARKKDLVSYFENRLDVYKTAKLKRQYLQENNIEIENKPGIKREKAGPKKQAEKLQREPLQEPVEKIEAMTYYNKLTDILRKLEKPSIYINKERTKYLFSNIILKTYFWKMFNELDKTPTKDAPENEENPQKTPKYPEELPDRLIYETFEESYILRTKRVSNVPCLSVAKPKPLVLKGISLSDSKKVFKVYFSKDEANQKGAKGKMQVHETKKPGLSKGQKSKSQVTQDENLFLSVNEEFDPFSEDFNWDPEATEKKDINSTFDLNINKDKYLIVYVTLCNAIDALVDTIEELDENNIPSDTLWELQKCNVSPSLKINNETLAEITSLSSEHSIVSDKAISQKESSTHSQSEYFEFLQELHWQSNLNTKKYFFADGPKSTTGYKDFTRSENVEQDIESQVKQSLLNIFSLADFRIKQEPYCLKEKAAQTEFLLEYDSEMSSMQETPERQMSDESVGEESKNIFYFLKNVDEIESTSTVNLDLP